MNINVKKYNHELDYEKVIEFLRNQYKENKNMVSWLPQRFDDLVYRVDTLYKDERGKLASKDYIYIYYDNEAIVALITPDSDACYLNIKNIFNKEITAIANIINKAVWKLGNKPKKKSPATIIATKVLIVSQIEQPQFLLHIKKHPCI